MRSVTGPVEMKPRAGMGSKGPDGLTARQRLFVWEYIQDWNAKEAALRAGYSINVAKMATGAEGLLKVPAVAVAVEKHRRNLERKAVVSAERVLEELQDVGMADPRQLFDSKGNIKPIREWTRGEAACVACVDVVKRNLTSGDGRVDEIIKIRMWDKPKTLEILARHLGMLTEKIEIRGDAELVSRLAGARRRIAIGIEEE
jgi:phage terminase small subunit